ncbi:mitochondrial outer membrane protein porin of 36 kDa [Tanacetum coccineum]
MPLTLLLGLDMSVNFKDVFLQAELQYLHENARINDSNGLTVKPVVNLSGVVRNNTIALGANISFDTAIGVLTKYNEGLSFTTSDLITCLLSLLSSCSSVIVLTKAYPDIYMDQHALLLFIDIASYMVLPLA